MKLIVVRHGQTIENVKGICQGQLPGSLTLRGKLQARNVARKLKNVKFDVIFCSDLRRAKQTAEEILKIHKKVPIIFTEELRELKKGVFEKKHGSFFDIAREKTGKELWEFKPNGGESWSDARKRARKFYNFLLKNYSDKTVLIVSHSTFIGILLSVIMNAHVKIAVSFEEHQTHECMNLIEVDKEGRGSIKTINCEKHVKKLVC